MLVGDTEFEHEDVALTSLLLSATVLGIIADMGAIDDDRFSQVMDGVVSGAGAKGRQVREVLMALFPNSPMNVN